MGTADQAVLWSGKQTKLCLPVQVAWIKSLFKIKQRNSQNTKTTNQVEDVFHIL